jgi:hypothetical protein
MAKKPLADTSESTSGPCVVFCRVWRGLSEAFPLALFDNLLGFQIEQQFELLALDFVHRAGGQAAWAEKAAVGELARLEAQHRERAVRQRGSSPLAGWVRKRVKAGKSPSLDQLRVHYLSGYKDKGRSLFELIAPYAGWVSHLIVQSSMPFHSEIFVLSEVSEAEGRSVASYLNSPIVRKAAGVHRRFGFAPLSTMKLDQKFAAREQLRDPRNEHLRALPFRCLEYLRARVIPEVRLSLP